MSQHVIAERILRYADDKNRTIHIRIYAPENLPMDGIQHAVESPWRCTFDVDGLPPRENETNKSTWVVSGVDSMDALLAALGVIRPILDGRLSEDRREISWGPVAERQPGHGIPRAISAYLGPVHERHLIEMMINEDTAFIARARQLRARFGDDIDVDSDED